MRKYTDSMKQGFEFVEVNQNNKYILDNVFISMNLMSFTIFLMI